jgi:hypothetical protein
VNERALLNPGRETVSQKLRDVGPRHDRALVDVEPVVSEPRFVREVRGRLAASDSRVDERLDALELCAFDDPIEMRHERVERKLQRMQYEPGRFIARVERAVAVRDSRYLEPANDIVQEGPYRCRRALS